ncbi:hypothetical protein DK66_3076 [Brucella suis 1330]|nr:hypothetical protein DK66_3076 [Brucella suis 1330]
MRSPCTLARHGAGYDRIDARKIMARERLIGDG